MKKLWSLIGVLVLVASTAAVVYLLFPRTRMIGIPHITTVYDTVVRVETRLDTVWRTRVIHHTDTLPNLIDTVTVQAAPETVYAGIDTVTQYVCPQALQVGGIGKRDQPTTLEGFTFTYDSLRTLLRRPWRTTYYTPGPLAAAVFDTFPPRLAFSAPPRECGFECRLRLLGIGTLAGTALASAGCAVLK